VLLSPRTVGATAAFTARLVLAPGEHVAEHYHPYSDEFVHVVRGRLRVRVDGERIDLDGDEALMIRRGARHRYEASGDEAVSALLVLAPLAPRPDLGHVDTEPVPRPDGSGAVVGGPS